VAAASQHHSRLVQVYHRSHEAVRNAAASFQWAQKVRLLQTIIQTC